MNQQTLFVGLGGLVIGALIAGIAAVSAVNTSNTSMMQMMGMHTSPGMHEDSMAMDDMIGDLDGKSGDTFDQAFIAGMIVHHQGAIDMAELAKENAKHDEIKQIAEDIISAQSQEIDVMKAWQVEWGYK